MNLQEELDDWIVVFRDAAQGRPVTEFTRHVDRDSQAMTGHYDETFRAGRLAAMG